MILFKDLGIRSGPSGKQDSAIFSGSSSSLLKRFLYIKLSYLLSDVMQDLNSWKFSQALGGMAMNQTFTALQLCS